MNQLPPYLLDALVTCPNAGSGVHSWLLAVANKCRRANLPESDAVRLISASMTRPPKPPTEVRSAVQKAYRTFSNSPRISCRRELHSISFDQRRLERLSENGLLTGVRNWRHFLWERSPKQPESQNAYSFLKYTYRVGEMIHVFEDIHAKAPAATIRVTEPMDCSVSEQIQGGGCGLGIWFLCNPVDGKWHSKSDGTASCRSEAALTDFRYMVLESDVASFELWMAFVVQMPARIAAIYTSGGRSIHALVRIDAHSKAEFVAIVDPLKRPLKKIGADAACLSAIRLTRLPGCRRPEKNGFQRLLYLNPNPPLCPIADMPVICSRSDALTRWRTLVARFGSSKGVAE